MVDVGPNASPRFNVLLTEDRPHAQVHWTRQLSCLLQPQGVVAHTVQTGRQAIELAESMVIHAAVVDLSIPIDIGQDEADATGGGHRGSGGGHGGMWLLELMQRLSNRPPVVIVRKPAFSKQQSQRLLAQALRLGAFSVLNQPVDVEQLLAVFQKLMDRRYRGTWPKQSEH